MARTSRTTRAARGPTTSPLSTTPSSQPVAKAKPVKKSTTKAAARASASTAVLAGASPGRVSGAKDRAATKARPAAKASTVKKAAVSRPVAPRSPAPTLVAAKPSSPASKRYYFEMQGKTAVVHLAGSKKSKPASAFVSQALAGLVRSFEAPAPAVAKPAPQPAKAQTPATVAPAKTPAKEAKVPAKKAATASKGAAAPGKPETRAGNVVDLSAARPVARRPMLGRPQAANSVPAEVGKYPEVVTKPGSSAKMTRKFFADQKRWGYTLEYGGHAVGRLLFDEVNVWVLSPTSKPLERAGMEPSTHRNPLGAFVRLTTTWRDALSRSRSRQLATA